MLLNGKAPPPLIAMSSVEEKEMKWLWYPYIPAWDATMIFGPGGAGKSHIAIDIASRVSTGAPFPGETTRRPPEKVLTLSAEDDPNYVLKPRLRKSGANMDNIFIPPMFFTVDQKGIELIDYYINDVTVGIVFIDPVVAYIGSKVDINKANEVRGFITGLHRLSKAHQIPIIYVHHTRKGNEGGDNDRAMGSADFINGSRSSLFVTTGPDGSHIMKHPKHNYSAGGATLGFEFGEKGFEWTGAYQLDGTKEHSRGEKRTGAAEWLRMMLAKGPMRAPELLKSADEHGFNERTLNRAKKGVAVSYLVSEEGKLKWYWKLTETEDGKTDVPVMGSQWGATDRGYSGRIEREIIARTDSRVPEHDGSVVSGRLEGPEGLDIDQMMDKVLK